ncbi:MAG: hypothetical protein RL419_1070 [Actinomycetota bacterium]|jgi:hypothetical protein
MSRHEPSLARRIAPAVALTGVGFALVNALDHVAPMDAGASPLGADQALPANGDAAVTSVDSTVPGQAVTTTVPPTPVTGASPVAPNTPRVTNAPQATTAQQQTQETVPAQSVAPQATAAPQTTAVPAQAATNDCGAIVKTGSTQSIEWRRYYGTIAVTAKFTSSKVLCDATADWQANDSKSQNINSYAVPYLNQQAVSSKSANIQGVSGATAVSVAYSRSLQSAIDAL